MLYFGFFFAGNSTNKDFSYISEKSFDFIVCSLFYLQIIVENVESVKTTTLLENVSKFLNENYHVSLNFYKSYIISINNF